MYNLRYSSFIYTYLKNVIVFAVPTLELRYHGTLVSHSLIHVQRLFNVKRNHKMFILWMMPCV